MTMGFQLPDEALLFAAFAHLLHCFIYWIYADCFRFMCFFKSYSEFHPGSALGLFFVSCCMHLGFALVDKKLINT